MLKVIIHIDETSSIPVWAECEPIGAFSQKERGYADKIAKFLMANPYEKDNKVHDNFVELVDDL